MAPRENNAYAKIWVTIKEHYGMLWYFLEWSIQDSLGFWIPRCEIRIPGTGFQYLSVELNWKQDSNGL